MPLCNRNVKTLQSRLPAIFLVTLASLETVGRCQDTSAPPDAVLYRDDWGVPNIWARSEPAAQYAHGMAQAQDRPETLVAALLRGEGRLAEVAGPDAVNGDIEARRLRTAQWAKARYKHLSPRTRAAIEAFCAGINAQLKDDPVAGFEHFRAEPYQVVARLCRVLWNAEYHLAMGELNAAVAQPSAVLPGRGYSNAWAIAPHRTAAGAPMLLIDPHWPSTGLLQLYEVRLP